FVEDYTAKGVGLRMADSHTGNHRRVDFMPLENIQRFLASNLRLDSIREVLLLHLPFGLQRSPMLGETFADGSGFLRTQIKRQVLLVLLCFPKSRLLGDPNQIKRFGFVRFIKIFDADRLVNKLCMVWVEHFKIHANIARFQGSPLKNSNTPFTNKVEKKSVPGPRSQNVEEENKPAIVLDETCVNQQDYSTSLMGKVKEFGSLTNLKVVLANAGFGNIKLKYMGGYWVMIEFQIEASKEKFKVNVGIGSWLS
ncbi:hypothetical protein Tco_0271653, partial [Tanacetum coccineum]